jgi:uncharacterized membrane protein
MPSRLVFLSDQLRTSYWFLPLVLMLTLGGAAFITVRIDSMLYRSAASASLSTEISNGSVITLLATMSGAIATIAGTVFSLMLVVLVLASQQYGPLIVANFIRDRATQTTFGVFIGTFIFCILVLEGVSLSGSRAFIPRLSVAIAIGLAITCALMMIYFINHIASGIRPTSIIGRITLAINDAIEAQYPARSGSLPPQRLLTKEESELLRRLETQSGAVTAQASGYLGYVDYRALLDLVEAHDVLLRLEVRPGSFIVKGSVIGYAAPKARCDAPLADVINHLLVISPHRAPLQDIELLYTQLVAIAVRALSAAINDPFTAMTCIDHLGEAIAKMSLRQAPQRHVFGSEGQLRLVLRVVDFEYLLHLCFDQVRHYSLQDMRVQLHLLETIRVMAEVMHAPHEEQLLQRYAGLVWGEARRKHSSEYEQALLDDAYHRACARMRD